MLKEWFYRICQNPKYSIQWTEFYEWIKNVECCGIKEFEACAATYRHWAKYILNTFKYGITNGITEGFNNKVKVLKRISNGIRNFDRFRTRILHSCNKLNSDWHEGLFVIPKNRNIGNSTRNSSTSSNVAWFEESHPTLNIEPKNRDKSISSHP